MSNQQNPSQDEDLARKAQQSLNMGAPSFTPSAPSFTPSAPSFTPGAPPFNPGAGQQQQQQQQQQPYYQNRQYQQQQPYGQQHYGGYQQNYHQQNNQHGGGYGQQQHQYTGHGRQQYNHSYNNYNNFNNGPPPQQPQQRAYDPPILRSGASQAPKPVTSDIKPKVLSLGSDGSMAKPKPGVLSLGADGSTSKPKVLSLGSDGSASKPKVLSLGSDGSASKPKVLSLGAESVAKVNKESDDTTEKKSVEGDAKPTEAKASDDKSSKESAQPTSENTAQKPAEKPAAASSKDEAVNEIKSDAVIQEQAAVVDEEAMLEMYGKEHLNVIFLGHVDAGKSTLGGSILVSSGVVDLRTLEKYRKEAKDSGNESWYLSWVMDQNKEERTDGKTIEVGQGFFETESRRFTILDAPGHKSYVSNMIGGASQADVGVLVISARKGEYETGFEKGGQTREHALLAKTQGVNKLIVAVNKMDDPTVEWSEERYKQCIAKPGAFLKGLGYNPSTDLVFIPVAGQSSANIKEPLDKNICNWYEGPSLLDLLNSTDLPGRKLNAPLMMPISLKMKDMGTVLRGKIEAGAVKKEQKYCIMPNKTTVTVSSIKGESEQDIEQAAVGAQVQLMVRGVDEDDVKVGYVLCSLSSPVHAVRAVEAHVMLLEVKSILVAGFQCMMHVHTSVEPVYFDALLHKVQKGTGRRSKAPPKFAKKGTTVIARIVVQDPNSRICVERFEDYNQLGRFTLRDQDLTIAIGKVTKLLPEY